MQISIRSLVIIFFSLGFTIGVAQHDTKTSLASMPLRQKAAFLFADTLHRNNDIKSVASTNMIILNPNAVSVSSRQSGYSILLDLVHGRVGQGFSSLPGLEVLENISDSTFLGSYFAWLTKVFKPQGIDGIYFNKESRHTAFFGATDSFGLPLKYEIVPFPEDFDTAIPFRIDRQVDILKNFESPASHFQPSFDAFTGGRFLFFDDNGRSIDRLVRAVQHRIVDESVVDKMVADIIAIDDKPPFVGKSANLSSEDWNFDAVRKSIVAFARRFEPITDMTDVEIGVLNNSSAVRYGVVPLLKRYTDNIIPAHPSVLANAANMRYFVVVAASADEVRDAAELISQVSPKFNNQKVLLYIGNQDDDVLADSCVSLFDAVFASPGSGDVAANLLTQALMAGIDVNNDTQIPLGLLNKGFGRLKIEKSRLGYAPAGTEGLNPLILGGIDAIMAEAVKQKATPGGQVLVARNGQVVYSHNFGFDSYDRTTAVDDGSIYDLASVTKVMATTPLMMLLYDKKFINNATTLGEVLPRTVGSNKERITIQDIMLHQAGFPASIAYSLNAIDSASLTQPLFRNKFSKEYSIRVDTRLYMFTDVRYKSSIFNVTPDSVYSIRVAGNLFMNRHHKDEMIRMLYDVPILKKSYRYSDLSLYFAQQIVEKYYNQQEDILFDKIFAQPLGASRLTFLPLNKFKAGEIVPTENDMAFRRDYLRGYVHDPGAAMMGGVAGHAGLFSNANDLAKMAQMLLNKGSYGGVRFIDASTVEHFTKQQIADNRRGLGFDKPEPDKSTSGPSSELASPLSYGHSGFTGTFVWIDPQYNLVYIFLSNRVNPHSYNKKLIEMGIRKKVQTVIYNSMIKN